MELQRSLPFTVDCYWPLNKFKVKLKQEISAEQPKSSILKIGQIDEILRKKSKLCQLLKLRDVSKTWCTLEKGVS